LSARETAVVMATVPTLLRPVAERGTAGRLDVWRLLLLVALGIKMPVIAELLRERDTTNMPRHLVNQGKSRRRKAIDKNYLWRLRKTALMALAETIAPLMPNSEMAVAA
jgi:hypothetical protein